MEILVTEEKKKIFRARKTMKISDRQQLESLHTTLLTAAAAQPEASPPALVNGSHKEELPRLADTEQNCNMDSNSLSPDSPVSPTSQSSPAPFLSLNLSPSSVSSQSPKEKEDSVSSPASPFHSLNLELKKMEEEDDLSEKQSPTPKSTNTEAQQDAKSKTPSNDQTADSDTLNGVIPSSPPSSAVSDCTAEAKADSKDSKDSVAPSVVLKSTSSNTSHPPPIIKSERKQTAHADDVKDESDQEDVKQESASEAKMEVDSVKVGVKAEKTQGKQEAKSSRPSSTPPSSAAADDKSSHSGIKRTLSEGHEKESTVKREGKRPKMERDLEAELEVKITTKARDHRKIEKIVQQLVNERLEVLQQTFFDKHFQELKGRVDKIDCATKHQSAINQLQAKIARLSKKFGEANQASENKKKQEALAAAAAAAAPPPPSAASTASATPAKTPTPISSQVQRLVRTSIEAKQIPSIPSSSSAVNSASAAPTPVSAAATGAPLATPVPMSTAPTIVQQTPILQLITSNSNAVPSLGTGITTSSSTGTYLLKAPTGSGMMTTGQPLLIQLPLSMANSQTGALVKIPVSSLSAANTFNNTKTTAAGTTLIFKPAPVTTTAAVSTPAVAAIPAIQTSAGQKPLTQISLTRAVYQGGTGGIVTPHAGVSVTTARTQAQSVSVAGALSSTSSLITSVPAATGSAAPGPPQGVSLTSKTDNQASGASTSKAAAAAVATAAPAARPKGSVIDLTEDDDDVQVTGVKKATVVAPSTSQRPHVAPHVASSSGARSSPQTSQNTASSSPVTIHYRPPSDSTVKSRTTSATPTRVSSLAPPPLPCAPLPPNLPPEAERTSPPQQPQLKLVPSQTGIVLSWCVSETDLSCATVESYHLYAYHQENPNSSVGQPHWKKIGEVKALPLPMACTLTQFQSGSTYHFAVRAKDIYGRFGPFCEPQCTNVNSSSS
ncbi:activating transcription factor 7-interacting protein 1 [Neosynchiropus ocellatus]